MNSPSDDQLLFECSSSQTPVYIMIAVSTALAGTLLLNHNEINLIFGKEGAILAIVGLAFMNVFNFIRRNRSYFVTNKIIASASGNMDVKEFIDVEDIGYSYTSQTVVSKILGVFGGSNYANICFCKGIYLAPEVTLYAIKDAEDKHAEILETLQLAKEQSPPGSS